MDQRYIKIQKKKKNHLTITADLSNVLRTINDNVSWKNNSTKFVKDSTNSRNKTINPLDLTKNLMNQDDIDRLFHKSKQKNRAHTNYTNQITEWAQHNAKDFVKSVKFLQVQDQTDKLLTGLPSNKQYDQELLNFLFNDQEKQDLTTQFKKQYLVGKIIGQGAYASVRVAVHRQHNKKVAIKVYEKNKIKQTQRKKSLRRQIKILQMLSHPNIVEIWDVVETNNHVNIVMEYLTGISLSTYLKMQPNNRTPQKNAKKIIKALADALKYLHERRISHRDIKLENIIINEDLSPKLIDFGFSTCIEKNKKIKLFCGTPSYMAPQIVQKLQYRGQNADVWALGVLSFVMITGYFPFKGATDEQLYRKINKAEYNKTDLCFSKQINDLISKMLTVNPSQRITASEIINHPWFKNSSLSISKKGKNTQNSYQYRRRTATSSNKSGQKIQSYIQSFKKFNQTCKQNLKMEIKLSKQSPAKLNQTCTQRKIAKQLTKCFNQKGLGSSFTKKEPLIKMQKTNRVMIDSESLAKLRKQEKSKNKIKRV